MSGDGGAGVAGARAGGAGAGTAAAGAAAGCGAGKTTGGEATGPGVAGAVLGAGSAAPGTASGSAGGAAGTGSEGAGVCAKTGEALSASERVSAGMQTEDFITSSLRCRARAPQCERPRKSRRTVFARCFGNGAAIVVTQRKTKLVRAKREWRKSALLTRLRNVALAATGPLGHAPLPRVERSTAAIARADAERGWRRRARTCPSAQCRISCVLGSGARLLQRFRSCVGCVRSWSAGVERRVRGAFTARVANARVPPPGPGADRRRGGGERGGRRARRSVSSRRRGS